MNKLTASNIAAAAEAWSALTKALGGLSVQDSEVNLQNMMTLLDQLLDFSEPESCANSEGVEGLIEFVTEWVAAYEARHVRIAESDPVELLRHLMESNKLTQKDLAAEFGGQPVVSAVLRGERKINLRQAIALGERFSLDFSAFIAQNDAIDSVEISMTEDAVGSGNSVPIFLKQHGIQCTAIANYTVSLLSQSFKSAAECSKRTENSKILFSVLSPEWLNSTPNEPSAVGTSTFYVLEQQESLTAHA